MGCIEMSDDVREHLEKESAKRQLPTEADLVQAVRIALDGSSVIRQLCDMLDALREGRLEYKACGNFSPIGYTKTPYKDVWIKKES